MTDEEISNLRKQLETFLTGICKDLVEGTMKEIKGGVYSPDLLAVFNELAERGKLFRNDTMKYGGLGGGNIPDKTADVTINFTWNARAFILTEELTHANGPSGTQYIGHDSMAQAAIDVGGPLGYLDKIKNTNTPEAKVRTGGTLVDDRYNQSLFQGSVLI